MVDDTSTHGDYKSHSFDPDNAKMDSIYSRMISLHYVIKLCQMDGIARRVFTTPAPSNENHRRLKWMIRPARIRGVPLANLYCYVMATGEVLHTYSHILHNFCGKDHDPFCRVCKMEKGNRIHIGQPVEDVSAFLRVKQTAILELPVDQPYGPCVEPTTAA